MVQVPKLPKVHCQKIAGVSKQNIYYTGPKLSEGPLPAFFYFTLTGHDSLCVNPFNQPIAFLEGSPIRCYSLTLPGHGEEFDNAKAIAYWAEQLAEGNDLLGEFLDSAEENIRFLMAQGYIDETKIAVGGLSRGGLIAAHLAARIPSIKMILGYAPMTHFTHYQEFVDVARLDIQKYDLKHIVDELVGRTLRFYIGNHDILVSTDACFSFISSLAKANMMKKIRSPQVEMMILPSIGHRGHGTAPHVFFDGADWLKKQLLGENNL